MAQVLISGNSLTIKSEATYEDLKLLAKYAPKALTLYDEDGKKETFKVDVRDGVSNVGPCGICFGGASKDGSGKAALTMSIPEDIDTENILDYVEDTVGDAVSSLNIVEVGVTDALETVRARSEAVRANITIVG